MNEAGAVESQPAKIEDLCRQLDEYEEEMKSHSEIVQAAIAAELAKRQKLIAAMKKDFVIKKKKWRWDDDIKVDYVDLLDKVYLDKPRASLTELDKLRRDLAEQRQMMKKIRSDSKKDITRDEWYDEDEVLMKLICGYRDSLVEPAANQIKELEVLNAQFRGRKAPNNTDGLLPKEVVARELLCVELLTRAAITFIYENFTREEFREFARKIRALRKKNRVPIASKKTGHRMVSKRALLNDIALRVKQYSKIFEALLLPDPWPIGILPMEFSSREIEWIISVCYGLSPRFDRTFEDSLKILSYSDVENLKLKVDYRINAIVNWQACRNILCIKASLYPEKVPRLGIICYSSAPQSLPSEPMLIYRTPEDCEVTEREKLLKSITQKILKPKIREMTMFLLLPDIADKLTCEEKRFIISVLMFEKPPNPCLDPPEFLRRFDEKLTIIEEKLENDLNELLHDGDISSDNLLCPPEVDNVDWGPLDTDIFSACYSKKGSRRKMLVSPEESSERLFQKRQAENKFLVILISKMWIYKDYNFADPYERIQFNEDFKFVLANRELMLRNREKAEKAILRNGEMAEFYHNYINAEDVYDEWDYVSWYHYDEIVLLDVDRKIEEPEITLIDEDTIRRACMDIVCPPREGDCPEYVDLESIIIFSQKSLKLPKRLRVQCRRPIKRKINKDDLIRVARRERNNVYIRKPFKMI
ncbi:unnamed protein product [Caenorhabditis brenneri]